MIEAVCTNRPPAALPGRAWAFFVLVLIVSACGGPSAPPSDEDLAAQCAPILEQILTIQRQRNEQNDRLNLLLDGGSPSTEAPATPTAQSSKENLDLQIQEWRASEDRLKREVGKLYEQARKSGCL